MATTKILLPDNAITIVRGSSKTLELAVTDLQDKVVNLTGASIYFTVRERLNAPNPLIYKSTGNVAEIEVIDATGGKAKIYISYMDTMNLEAPKQYVFDVWVVLSSGKRYPVVQPSVFEVVPGVTVLT